MMKIKFLGKDLEVFQITNVGGVFTVIFFQDEKLTSVTLNENEFKRRVTL